MYLKHDYYQQALAGTDKVLCRESAAEYLNLSNGNFGKNIEYYLYPEAVGREVIVVNGILCTSVDQTINDLLEDPESDEQVLLESLGNYFYENQGSFNGLKIKPGNQERFAELEQAAISYYDD